MSRFLVGAALLALVTSGCDENDAPYQAYYQPKVVRKPVVAVVPVIDSTQNDYSWNLSEALTASVFQKLVEHGSFFLVSPERVRKETKNLSETQNPFGIDTSWIKKTFQGNEFVVFLELVEHQEVLRQSRQSPLARQECPADLNMSMRVRVFDVRGNQPKVVLQEIVHDTRYVPRQFTKENFTQVAWGDPEFEYSTVGMAQADFTRRIVSRVEDYIQLAYN